MFKLFTWRRRRASSVRRLDGGAMPKWTKSRASIFPGFEFFAKSKETVMEISSAALSIGTTRIFKAHKGASHILYVQPGLEFPDNTEWHDAHGNPLLIAVVFIDGEAEVPKQLGRWLIDRGDAIAERPIRMLLRRATDRRVQA